jgi:Ca2+-binding EF-hand superfamily protein
LAACIDKNKAVTTDNLRFAFHHFDVDNSGFITAENLQEVFRRQGKMMTLTSVKDMIEDIEPSKEGQLNFAEFQKMMMETLAL